LKKNQNQLKPLVRQRITWRKKAVVLSIAAVIALGTVIFFQFQNPEKAFAADCESSYVLDFSNPATYSVTCGSVNASNWNVKNQTCTYSSPVFNAGGEAGQPNKIADIALRINSGGNLEGDDTCWVNFKVNGSVVFSNMVLGDTTNGVFSIARSLTVPADGNYQVNVTMKNNKSNESWYMKNGDVTACLKTFAPLPVSLGNFSAVQDKKGTIELKWLTYTEINNDYFSLERSGNGTEFTPITRIEGAGNYNSVLKYQFTDKAPLSGINYYRLRQVDFDGNSRLSQVISASVSVENSKAKINRVYPNPFLDHFIVDFNSPSE